MFLLLEHLKQGLAAYELYYRELRKDFELRIKEAEGRLEIVLSEIQMASSMEDNGRTPGKECGILDFTSRMTMMSVHIADEDAFFHHSLKKIFCGCHIKDAFCSMLAFTLEQGH